MKKIVITTILIAIMFFSFNANAQLGVTREGKIKHIVTGVSPWFYVCDSHYYLNYIPKYQPKLKYVTIKAKLMRDRGYYDSWSSEFFYEYRIHFDTLGNIVEIKKWDDDERDDGVTRFSYKEGKVIEVSNNYHYYRLFSFKYDDNGHLSKILSGGSMLRTTWTPQGFLYTAKKYEDDHLCSWFNKKYIYSQNGRVIEEMDLKKDNTVLYKRFIYKDSHGVTTKIIRGSVIFYYENKYDESGNLFQHLEYKMVDGEKYYEEGWQYEYEYEFYE